MISFLLALWFVVDVSLYLCVILDWKRFKIEVLERWEPNHGFALKLMVALLTILFLGPLLVVGALYRIYKNPA